MTLGKNRVILGKDHVNRGKNSVILGKNRVILSKNHVNRGKNHVILR